MIIQTSMRTDIPAFYSKWFINRIKEGFVLVRNPYNPSQVTKYSLSPDVVDLIAFCTKNPTPMLPHLDRLKQFGQYWFVTITPYGKDVEPNVPPKGQVMESFIALSKSLGEESVGWRYDPIFIDGNHTAEWHIKEFEKIAEKLSGYTSSCVISFIDIYKKVARNFPHVREVSHEDKILLGKTFVEIADKYGMIIKPCAEGNELGAYGADCTGCITVKTLEIALQEKLNVPLRKFNQRKGECACILGTDIGAYDSCGHLCRYCYANTNPAFVRKNMKSHDPCSPFLLGGSLPEDIIHNAEQKSWIDNQTRLLL